jgi:hypothetical protein
MPGTERSVFWARVGASGLEHLRLVVDASGAVADGVVVGTSDREAFRLRYRIRCDTSWTCREVHVESLEERGRTLALTADGRGHWQSADGQDLPGLRACLDVDIAVTPFTNTLPIRRLALAPGQSSEVRVVYVAVPALTVGVARQRYTCLPAHGGVGRWRYEGLDTRFAADLTVDADGLVVDYGNIWRRSSR